MSHSRLILSTRAAPLVLVIAAFLAIASLTRLGLALATGLDAIPMHYWPQIFLRGLGFDLATLAWLLAPILMFKAVRPQAMLRSSWYGGFRLAIFFCPPFVIAPAQAK